MTFAQRRNCLTTHFSERIPVVKQRISLLCVIWGNVRPLNLPRVLGSVLNWTRCTCWPHEGILFPDLGIRWRWVVNITLRPLYLQGENPDAKWIGTVYLLIKTWRNAYSPSCKTLCPANGIELFIDLNRGTSRQTIFTSIFEINYCRRLWISAVTSALGRVPFQRSTAQRLALHRFLLA